MTRIEEREIDEAVRLMLSIDLKTGEEQVHDVLMTMLLASTGKSAFSLITNTAPIVHVHREFPVARGRVDILLTHEDGSITLVEVKKGGCRTRVMAGIGQLSMYAVLLSGRNNITIRRVLAWDFIGDLQEEESFCDACELAGVIPFPIGRISDHVKALMDSAAKYEAIQ